jgi:hypothetical protein
MKPITSIVSVVILVAVTGCTATRSMTGKIPHGKTVYVMSDRELDDYTIHNAIIGELQKRGHRVVDSGDKAPASAQGSLVLHYLDDWNWDMSMYLAALNIRVLDESTSEPVAIGTYRTPFFHTYANSVKEVSMLFSRLDNQPQM